MNTKTGLKRFLHKFFKAFIILLLATAAINILLFAVIYGNHKSKLKKESTYLNASGKFVEVNGHNMHIIIEGDETAEVTLVFLHSTGVVDDSVSFKPLFDELKGEYRLVFVERSGTGFSEVSGSDRDIDNILEETRTALSKSGIKGSYVILPVGTAGIEAIHWANKYPDEILGVIGINMNYPEQYAEITTEQYCGFFDYLMVPFYSIGGQRLVQSLYPTNEQGLYTNTQMLTRNALISSGGYTKDIYSENLKLIDNAGKVAAEGWPEETKMYLIYANPLMEPYRDTNEEVKTTYEKSLKENPEVDYIVEYNKGLREKFEAMDNVTIDEMGGPFLLYTYDPKGLGEKVKGFINSEIAK